MDRVDELDRGLVDAAGERASSACSAPSRLAFAFRLAFEELWDARHGRAHRARSSRGPSSSTAAHHGATVVHARARRRAVASRREAHSVVRVAAIRIASPVLTAGPILGTLVEVVKERRCDVAGVVDDTQSDDVFRQWSRNGVSAWKIPLLDAIVTAGAFSGKPSTPWSPGSRPGLHAREGRGRRRRVVRRLVQLLPLGRAERRERPRDRGSRDGRRARRATSTTSAAATRSRRRRRPAQASTAHAESRRHEHTRVHQRAHWASSAASASRSS